MEDLKERIGRKKKISLNYMWADPTQQNLILGQQSSLLLYLTGYCLNVEVKAMHIYLPSSQKQPHPLIFQNCPLESPVFWHKRDRKEVLFFKQHSCS
jgi:hypothetical protein